MKMRQMYFASVDVQKSDVAPGSLNAAELTVDVTWYSGVYVPRYDYETGSTYMLRLDMAGCKMDRLNAGAAVFDCHMSGTDYRSYMADRVGTQAQMGVVLKAWADGAAGKATLKFDAGNEDAVALFGKIQSGIVCNLSFGTTINSTTMEKDEGGQKFYVATDWEPFEISPVTIPADFQTTFLSAQFMPAAPRAISPPKEQPVINNEQAPADTRAHDEALAAATTAGVTNGVTQERNRISGIQQLALKMKPFGITEEFSATLISSGASLEDARTKMMDEMASAGTKDAAGVPFNPTTKVEMTRDGAATKLGCMESALLLRSNPQFGLSRKQRHDGSPTNEFLTGCGPDYQKKLEEQGREYMGFTLLEMAREALTLAGKNTRGWNKSQIADEALSYARAPRTLYFDGGAQASTDFPSILANVANKSARMSYEAYPQTFKPFSRMVSAADFKPISRVQLSDAPALEKLNERGEFRRANLSDTNQTYKLAPFGKIVSLTRTVIINDDLQMFTRVPAVMGVAAARMESDTVWAVLTGNQVMTEDALALFHTTHKNLNSGGGSALALAGMGTGRSKLRLQKGPQGTVLNLTPRFLLVPTVLETTALQLIYPQQLAATAVTGVIPEWVMSLVPIVEPRLDADSATAWYMVADNAVIDTLEYCYLEGQAGVFIETRQGWEVDGIEIKVREDFAAAAIDFRGMQKNAGA